MRLVLALSLLLGALPAAGQERQVVTLVADVWCPYNCRPDGELLGVGIDLAKRAFEAKGLRVEYRAMDYETAVKETRAGRHVAIVGAFRSDAPDFVFPEEPMGMSRIGVWVRKGDAWRFTGAASLAGRKVGVIGGYTYGEPFDAFLKANKAVSVVGANALDVLIARLLAGEIDTVFEDQNVFTLRARGLYVADRVEAAGAGKREIPLYLGFSPRHADAPQLARAFSEGVSGLRRTGELGVILRRYGVKDWK